MDLASIGIIHIYLPIDSDADIYAVTCTGNSRREQLCESINKKFTFKTVRLVKYCGETEDKIQKDIVEDEINIIYLSSSMIKLTKC